MVRLSPSEAKGSIRDWIAAKVFMCATLDTVCTCMSVRTCVVHCAVLAHP